MEPSILKDKIILIVDDYRINTELLSLLVSDAGAISLTASNGKECIEIIKKQKVDMVLMDNHMPVMDGIEATTAIRTLPQGKDIVIIGITGSDDRREIDVCLKAGMDLVCDKLTLNAKKLSEIAGQFIGNPNNSTEQNSTPKFVIDQSNSEIKNNNINCTIMDYEKALREFENDNDLLVSLIEDFNRIIHSQLVVMRQALDRSDFECIRNESHGIKGGAASLCALPLSDAAKSIEIACKQHAEKQLVSGLLDDLAYVLDSFDKFTKTKTSQ
jgi:two-component system, sensor histidine kinase and response regulator